MKHVRIIIAAILSAGFLVAAPVVLAVQESTAASSSTTTTITTTLAQRLAANKAAFKTALTTAQTDRLKLKCIAAQGLVKIVDTRTNTNAPLRVQNYTDVQTTITKLITKLKTLDIDTTTLATEQATLATKATQVKTDYTTYKTQLSDLESMGCAADPTSFQAALAAARTTHDTLVKEIADIRLYVTGTIKPTLQQLRTQVAAKASSSTGGNQ